MKARSKQKDSKKTAAAEAKPGNEAHQLRMETLELLQKAIDITKADPDPSKYTALTRALSAFKTADEMAAKQPGGRPEKFTIDPEVIRIIEEELLGIFRKRPQKNAESK
jgi:hypothetical protein